jgi:hypothetical protein
LPEAPPRPRGAGDLGPAKAESPVLSRVAEARLYSSRFCAPRNAFRAERFLEHAQVTQEQVRDRSCALVKKPLRRDAASCKGETQAHATNFGECGEIVASL